MAIQTNYNERMDAAREGMIANMEPKRLISRSVETEAGIGFGKVVVQGDDDMGVKASEAGAVYRGVTVWDRGLRPEGGDTFGHRESARIMTSGVVWVKAAAAVSAGDAAGYIAASGNIVPASTTGATAIPNASFDTTAASGVLVKLRLA